MTSPNYDDDEQILAGRSTLSFQVYSQRAPFACMYTMRLLAATNLSSRPRDHLQIVCAGSRLLKPWREVFLPEIVPVLLPKTMDQ